MGAGGGGGLWKWREVTFPKTAFDLIQNSIRHLGCQFEASSQDRVGRAMAEKIRKFKRKMESITSGKKRKRVRAETWVKLSIKPDEVKQTPKDVVTQLTEENEDLRNTIEDQAANLYWKMREELTHRGKNFTQVGEKQQRRHLTQIQ